MRSEKFIRGSRTQGDATLYRSFSSSQKLSVSDIDSIRYEVTPDFLYNYN